MSNYLQEAKDDFDHSQGDVTAGYNQVLKEYAKIKALIAIAEEIRDFNETVVGRLDQLSTDLQNLDYSLQQIKSRTGL